MRYKILLLFFVHQFSFGQFSDNVSEPQTYVKNQRDPVKFTHVPILLLKINPLALLGINNTLQYGAELVPPFGKFSLSFDYGKGKGSQSLNKYIKANQKDNVTTIYRGEVRMYFSDWFPFYSLDKKPFGRYYAIEYFQGTYDRSFIVEEAPIVPFLPMVSSDQLSYTQKNQAIHLKIGKHFHINKFIFIDVFAGAGIGKQTSTNLGLDQSTDKQYILPDYNIKYKFLGNNSLFEPNSKGLYFSTTSGIRLALVL